MSTREREGEATLRHRVDELGARVQRLRSFGSLRRRLRVAEGDDEIAAAAKSFTLDVLGCSLFAVYSAEKEDSDFQLLASSKGGADLPPILDRGVWLAQELERQTSVDLRDAEPVAALFPPSWSGGTTLRALALRGAPGQLIGVLVVGGSVLSGELLDELLDELVFDVESALAARMITRLRAEELAVLEIQERELVGLLRDVEARDAIIQRDLEEARQFQRKMLGAPPRVPGARVEVVYKPLGLVGGDLYAVSVDEDRLRLFVADATGHGVRASLTTMFIKSGYEAVRAQARDPASLLSLLNNTIAHTYRSSEMLFSAVCVDLDLATGRVSCASAAHPPVCLVKSNAASFIEGGGAFLGLRTGMRYSVQETFLEPGDGVYLYTDGFSEARKQNVQFGDERLSEAILASHKAEALAGAAVAEAVTAFLDGTPMDDDGTFVGVRFGVEADEPSPSVRNIEATKNGGRG